MGIITAIGLLIMTGIVQMTRGTATELTAEVFADNDIGIAGVRSHVAVGDIIDLDPAVMVAPTH